jgi:hypothetical protein
MTPRDKAQAGLVQLEETILDIIAQSLAHGLGNSDIARALGIESDFEGKQHNYLSWSIVGLLVNAAAFDTKSMAETGCIS